MKFIKLDTGFCIQVEKIIAAEFSEVPLPKQLRIYTAETIFDLYGKRAEKAWKTLQKLIKPV